MDVNEKRLVTLKIRTSLIKVYGSAIMKMKNTLGIPK